MEIRMIKFWNVISESCVTVRETHFTYLEGPFYEFNSLAKMGLSLLIKLGFLVYWKIKK